jgi:hypothetical protein
MHYIMLYLTRGMLQITYAVSIAFCINVSQFGETMGVLVVVIKIKPQQLR